MGKKLNFLVGKLEWLKKSDEEIVSAAEGFKHLKSQKATTELEECQM